jgi:ActR/RegA family two-component response regulator
VGNVTRDSGGPRAPSDPHRDLSGALHDVSNALTVMLGWLAEARLEGASSESVAYALGIIEQRARAARDLARRAIGGKVGPLPRDDSLEAVIADVVEGLAVEAQHAGVHFACPGDASGVRIPQPDDFSQILTNLVLNAIAHAPRGSTITLLANGFEKTVHLEVSDEGPGVRPERRESIFEGDSKRDGGVGIGLRHARALARDAGGDLEMLSPEPDDVGARFRLTWPRALASLPPPMSSVPRERLLEGRHILVVEDDLDVTLLLEAALGARGALVTVVRTRPELDAALAGTAEPHDAALVDLSPIADDVPGAFAALRRSAPEATLVLISGNADGIPPAVSDEGIRFVRKPFEVREVVDALVAPAPPPAEDSGSPT